MEDKRIRIELLGNGKRQNRNQENRESDDKASYILEAERGAVQEDS